MATWLGSILGVVVVGVMVELLTQNRRMGNFIRSIYGFVVLLVIVSPLPKLLKTDWWSTQTDELINTEMLHDLQQNSKQAQVIQTLHLKGYDQAIVTVVDKMIYVNLGISIDEISLNELQKDLGEGVIII
ncbi:MAG: stage III sporulation protein AF [Clostridia bacterium]|nr:stage III sporulation protein AF [Clostridia bacterium]